MIKEIGKARYGKEKGFTLVELLVVIAIIAILAIVSIAGYTQFIANARENNVVNELTQLRDMFVDNDVNDSDYFIADDGVMYVGSVKNDRMHDGSYTLSGAANGTGEATLIKYTTETTSKFQTIVDKLFDDINDDNDDAIKLVSLSDDAKQVIYTYQYDDQVIFATWDLKTGAIDSIRVSANVTGDEGKSNVAEVFEYLMTGEIVQTGGTHNADATLDMSHTSGEKNGTHGTIDGITYKDDKTTIEFEECKYVEKAVKTDESVTGLYVLKDGKYKVTDDTKAVSGTTYYQAATINRKFVAKTSA